MNQKYPQKVSLVIPVYNNAKTLVHQLQQCEKVLESISKRYEIIVAEDCSNDNSLMILKKFFRQNKHIKIISNAVNLGIAKNIYQLYKKAKYTHIALFSVDGDWEPKDIATLLRTAHKNNADIVIGKRTYEGYTLYRKMLSFFYNFLPILFFQVKTYDAGSIKILKKDLIRSIPLISKSVFFEAEMIIRAKKKNKNIIAIPIHFKKHKYKESSSGKLSLILAALRDLLILRLKL